MDLNIIHNMDCLEGLKRLPDNSVNLILIDPPYNIAKASWDKWKTVEAYVEWMGLVFKECERVLAPNGSFYFWHNDFLQIAELQHWIYKNTAFQFNSFIIWDKGDFRALSWKNPSDKSKLRSWFNTCEFCLFYTFQDGTGLEKVMLDVNNFKTLRNYFEQLQKYIGVSKKIILEKVGQRADHCFRWGSTQWDLPTEETYNELINVFKIDEFDGFRSYESLRREYEALRQEYEALRYVHNLEPNHKALWTSNERNSGKYHPTQKPLDLMEKIIRVSSREGDVVLDCFGGSGSTFVACKRNNRNFIGFEREKKYVDIAYERLEKEA